MTPKIPLQDVKTRWGSTYCMLERTLELKPSLLLFCGESSSLDLLMPNVNEWDLLAKVKILLKPMYLTLKEVSHSKYEYLLT